MTVHTFLSSSFYTHNHGLYHSFSAINWQAPWLRHLCQLGYLSQTVAAFSHLSHQANAVDTSADICGHPNTIVAEILNTALQQQLDYSQNQPPKTKPTSDNQAHALRFVAQDALPEGTAYESFIATTGNIPTRDNLHDLFNGSIWLTFPKTKALLNYHHRCEIAAQGISASRGRVRDTITVFDENGAIMVTAEPNIGAALIAFDWQASLVMPRAQWDNPTQPRADAQAAVYIFGHALLEQLVQPRKPLCAHSVVIDVTPEFFALSLPERMAHIDDRLATYMHTLLSQNDVTPCCLAPLPILGVPHFWDENANPEFYEDSYVFRSGRRTPV